MCGFDKVYAELCVAEKAGVLTINSSRQTKPGMYVNVVFNRWTCPEKIRQVHKRVLTLAPSATVEIQPGEDAYLVTMLVTLGGTK